MTVILFWKVNPCIRIWVTSWRFADHISLKSFLRISMLKTICSTRLRRGNSGFIQNLTGLVFEAWNEICHPNSHLKILESLLLLCYQWFKDFSVQNTFLDLWALNYWVFFWYHGRRKNFKFFKCELVGRILFQTSITRPVSTAVHRIYGHTELNVVKEN